MPTLQLESITPAEAQLRGCDCVQLKYDGIWSRIRITRGTALFFDRESHSFKSVDIPDRTLSCVLIGDHMAGTLWSMDVRRAGRTFVYDCWEWDGADYSKLPYFDRYRLARAAVHRLLPQGFTLVANHPIAQAETVMAANTDFKGLVFRRGADDANQPIYCQRRYPTVLETVSVTPTT